MNVPAIAIILLLHAIVRENQLRGLERAYLLILEKQSRFHSVSDKAMLDSLAWAMLEMRKAGRDITHRDVLREALFGWHIAQILQRDGLHDGLHDASPMQLWEARLEMHREMPSLITRIVLMQKMVLAEEAFRHQGRLR